MKQLFAAHRAQVSDTVKNNQGHAALFFVFLVPLFVLLLVITMEFSRLVATKIKLQGSLDRAVFKGAEYLTGVLNQTAQFNREAHEMFLETKKGFEEATKMSLPSARNLIKETWSKQHALLEEKMTPVLEESWAEAYRLVEEEVRKDFPRARVLHFYYKPAEIVDGRVEAIPFSEMEGPDMDPTGHRDISKQKDFEARIAFVKKTGPSEKTALSAGAEVTITKSVLSFLLPEVALRAVSAAEPFGGSIWSYALTKDEDHLYQTSFVPVATLPAEGFLNFWEDVSPYEIEH